MDLKSAIDALSFLIEHRKNENTFILLRQKEIEALKSVLHAAGKQKPDWPFPKDQERGIWQCWTCGYVFDKEDRPKFCPKCGQALEWPEYK